MERRTFEEKLNMERFLANHPDEYFIESEVARGLVYITKGNQFGIIRNDGYLYWLIEDTLQEIGVFKEEIQKEIRDILADIKQLKSLSVERFLI